MLTPVLWGINLVGLKLDYDQVKAASLPGEYLPKGEIRVRLQ
jgi:hypothetical protein